MAALAAANAATAALFGILYALAGARVLSQGAFLACLGVLFALATSLWVRAARRGPGGSWFGRFGRIAGGLVITVIATPVVVLAPVLWLDGVLPPEAGFDAVRRGMFLLVLLALALVVLVNLAGVLVLAFRGAGRPGAAGAQ